MQNKYLLLAIHPNRMAGGFSNMWKRTDHLTKKKQLSIPSLLLLLRPLLTYYLLSCFSYH
jgi:hypothetical protein